jgi:phage FluMu protein Com
MGRVIRLTPARVLAKASQRFLREAPVRCPKCGSTFVGLEPAFVHCRYCGKLARIAKGSLLDQELFELRAGLRLAP